MDIDTFSSIVWGAVLVGVLISIYFARRRRWRRTKRLLILELLKAYFQSGMPADQLLL
jgi:O-antigen/teichoic acid export membrane protein